MSGGCQQKNVSHHLRQAAKSVSGSVIRGLLRVLASSEEYRQSKTLEGGLESGHLS
jgi:hypothetical protein